MGWVYREVVGHNPGVGVIARRGGWVGGSGWRVMIVTSYLRHAQPRTPPWHMSSSKLPSIYDALKHLFDLAFSLKSLVCICT